MELLKARDISLLDFSQKYKDLCLVSSDGSVVDFNSTIIVAMSYFLKSILSDNECQKYDVNIQVPIEAKILKRLRTFLSTGQLNSQCKKEISSIGYAARILGIDTSSWVLTKEEQRPIVKVVTDKERTYTCEQCKVKYKRINSFAKHVVEIHGAPSPCKTYKCELCMKT